MESNSVKDTLPVTAAGAEAFLAGGSVEGIGPVYARRLVEKYGPEAVEKLRDDPASVDDIAGLGASRISAASESLRQLKRPLDLVLFLYSCGVQELFIDRIFGKYRSRVREIVVADPYQMVENVWRLSFFTADKIGKALGIAEDDPRRLRGALLTAVKHYADNGHLFATPDQAAEYAAGISSVEEDKVAAVAESLIADGRLVESRGGWYLPVFYEAERNGARRLLSLASSPTEAVDASTLPDRDMQGHEYTPRQKEAIRMAVEHPVMVLTGGPGSGKTTVLKGILDYFSAKGLRFTLAAPTGRAAKRMSTLTGYEASTIHHLLGYRQGEGYHNKSIETDVLVIDEGSMMEQVLFDHLLEAVRPGTRIIMVGDVDQLPAIGAGDVMRELIKSDAVPVAVLDENFRQSAGSLIAGNARAINEGQMPEDNESENFIIIDEKGIKEIHDRILRLVSEELPQAYGISPVEIQVVTPQQMGPLGARQLNVDLQKKLNPDAPGIRRGLTEMRLGDPVMQTANSRERGLYNGEVGHIVEVDPEERFLTVEYPGGRRSEYQRNELSELVLAYATTVHKLQGSEVDYMVMPVTMAHRPMLYRNLLYTGVSRARNLCALVGEKEAIRYAVDNVVESTRNSNFSARLQSVARKIHSEDSRQE